MKTLSRIGAAAAVLVAATAFALVGTSAASAHVTVSTNNATAGGYAVLTFKVPTESETASTVGLTVQLPTDTPFTSVLVNPVPGWSAKLETTKLANPLKDDDGNSITSAVTRIVWTASDGGLTPGEYGAFSISVGPLPEKPGTLFLPVVQKYSDGTEVDWVEQAQGDAEPEHPAPSVTIVAADDPAPGTTADSAHSSPSSLDGWSFGFGVAGLLVGLGASVIAGLALRRARR